MVEVKEGVVVGVSSSEWAGHVGQKLLQNFIINFWQKLLLGKKDMKIIIIELNILGRKI